jgi:hypothetical protein
MGEDQLLGKGIMNNIIQKRLFCVIDCLEPFQRGSEGFKHAEQNARTAFDYGAHGVFLSGKTIGRSPLVDIYNVIRSALPKKWVGLCDVDITKDTHPVPKNYAAAHARVAEWCEGLSGLWTKQPLKRHRFRMWW